MAGLVVRPSTLLSGGSRRIGQWELWENGLVSYDLAVYAAHAASAEDIRDLMAKDLVLHLGQSGGGFVQVTRGVRRRYSFTVEGPTAVEPEDVPEKVLAVLLGAQWLYSIIVEGSSQPEIPHARRFARRLAQALDGAALDCQTEETWCRSRSRQGQPPVRRERVSTVELSWYCLRDDLVPDPAALYAEVAQGLFPEALPRRFGETEPFQGKWADAGRAGFLDSWHKADGRLFTAGSWPCVGGHVDAGPSATFPSGFWSMSLEFFTEPMRDPAWRAALQQLFVRLADGLPAFYAAADITTGHIWSGRSLWADNETEWRIVPVRFREGWLGLPPKPTWWAWLGEPFHDYFPSLPAARTVATAGGVLYSARDEPDDPGSPVSLATWLPEGLFARLADNPTGQQPVPLTRAVTIPGRLRRANP